MPLYPFKCPKCKHEQDLFREIDQRDDPVQCEKCGAPMCRTFAATKVGKESYQFRLFDSKGGTVATGRGGAKKGRWYRP